MVKDDEIDLREIVGLLIDRKWWILGPTALFLAIGVACAMLMAPVYQAQALVQVESKMPTIPGLSDLASLGGGGSTAATTEVALLTSRTVIGSAVDQLQLDIQVKPVRFPLIGGFISRRFTPESDGQVASPWLGMSRYGWGKAWTFIACRFPLLFWTPRCFWRLGSRLAVTHCTTRTARNC